ncbi:MAG TPA: amino acid adenylation domain-containing protein, partial [Polyangiales bacterium]
DGPVELARLQRAVASVYAQHEALRARIVNAGESMCIEIGPADASPPLVLERPAGAGLDAWAMAVIGERFDLRAGWSRVRIARLHDGSHGLVLVVHRLGSDTGSLEILHRDLIEAYRCAVTPEAAPRQRAVDGLVAYLAQAERVRTSDATAALLTRAAARLADEIPAPDLPLDFARPTTFSGRGEIIWQPVAIELRQAVDSLAASYGLDRDAVLLTAYFALLQRYGQKDDFTVGIDLDAGPAHEGVAPWTTRCVLRPMLRGQSTLREALQQVARALEAAREESCVAFDDLERAVAAQADASHTPLFQVGYAAQAAVPPPCQVDGVSFTRCVLPSSGARSDLTLRVRPAGDGLLVGLERATDLLSEATVARMLQGYLVALQALPHALDQALGRLPVMTDCDRQRVLSAASVASYDPRKHAHVRFEEQAARSPDAVAVTMHAHTLSYRELDARANRLAARLHRQGVAAEALVGIFCERSIDMLVCVLAVMKSGGAYVPLDPAHPAARLEAIMDDAAPCIVLTQGALRERCPTRSGSVLMTVDDPSLADEPDAAPGGEIAPDRLVYVIFTSGSTGRPKGVEVTHRSLNNFLSSMAHTPGMQPVDRILAVTTLSFDIAALELLLPLTVGASVEIADRSTCVDAEALKQRLDDPAITMLQATPATFRMLIEVDYAGKPELRALCGGEACPPDLVRALLPRVRELWNLYGPTETTVWSTVQQLTSAKAPISIGRTIDNTSIRVLSPLGEPVPPGAVGELFIGGDGVARGYRGRPELTREKFVPDPFAGQPAARMYRTGDLGRFLADGTLSCLGRVDFQVKIRGFRIELGDIESSLLQQPGVRQAVVVAREDTPGDKRLVAYVVISERTHDGVGNELRRRLEQRLPTYMVPALFVVLDALPLNASGKIDRRALPAPDARAAARGASALPRNDVELMLQQAFSEVLGVAELDLDARFFDAGGDSLSALRLLRRIALATRAHVSIADLFAAPSVRALAETLRNKKHFGDFEPRVVQLRRGTGDRALFCLCGIVLYQHLARALPEDTSVYGIFAPSELRPLDPQHLRKGQVAYPRVQEIAADYVDAIRSVQTHGPYRIAGFSFGGMVAYEVAQQLRRSGEEVRLLALIDTALPAADQAGRLHRALRLARRLVRDDEARSLVARLLLARLGADGQHAWTDPQIAQLRDVLGDLEIARYGAELAPYDGDLVMFSAFDENRGHKHVRATTSGWRDVVRGQFSFHEIYGGHASMLVPPGVETLATQLVTHLG